MYVVVVKKGSTVLAFNAGRAASAVPLTKRLVKVAVVPVVLLVPAFRRAVATAAFEPEQLDRIESS